MIRVDLQGVQDLRRALDSIHENEINWIKRQIAIAVINIQREARRECPVDTGRLRSSIQWKLANRGLAATVYSDAFYAPYVEYGTGKYALNGAGRSTPWVYYYAKIGRMVRTEGRRPKLMLTKAANNEMPELRRRILEYHG